MAGTHILPNYLQKLVIRQGLRIELLTFVHPITMRWTNDLIQKENMLRLAITWRSTISRLKRNDREKQLRKENK